MPSGAMAAAAEELSASSDMFDEILMAEERFHGEGYQEGYAEGSHAGVVEGRRYGSLHGAKIGSEIGCYLGFALTWQCLLQKCLDEKKSKKMRALDSLIGMIQKFPYEDPTYDKLQEDLEKIRGKFKQMKINMDDQRRSIKRTDNWKSEHLHTWSSGQSLTAVLLLGSACRSTTERDGCSATMARVVTKPGRTMTQ